MKYTALVLALLATNATANAAAAADVCVKNASGGTWFFVVDTLSGDRASATLSPGHSLCVSSPGARKGQDVSVFRDVDAMEGCSRLATAGQPESLLDYADFDRCRWVDTPR